MKKLLAIILALSFLVLSACSGGEDPTVPTVPQSTVPESTVPTEPEIPVRTAPISPELFWLTARGDNAYSGSSSSLGRFSGSLETIWKADMVEGYLPSVFADDLDGDGKNEVLYSYCGYLYAVTQDGALLWKSEKMADCLIYGMKDCGKNGEKVLVTLFGKYIVLLDPLTGKTLYKSDFAVDHFSALYCMQLSFADFDGNAGNELVTFTDANTIRVLSFYSDYESPTVVMECTNTKFKDYLPSFALGDYNNDGQTDIFYAGYGEVGVFNGKTGEEAASVEFTPGDRYGNGRTYGQFYVRDVNGDGFDDAVIISYSLNEHVEVILSNGSELSLAYLVFYEFDASSKGNVKSLKSLSESLVDVTGNGDYRLVYSTYNADAVSKKWETHIMRADAENETEAVSTEQLIDGAYLRAIADLDGDGIGEIVVSKETTLSVSTYPEIFVYKFDGTEYKRIAGYNGAYVLTNDFVRSDSTHCCYDPERIRAIALTLDTPALSVKTRDGKYAALSLSGGTLTAVAEYSGEIVYGTDVDGDGYSEVFVIDGNICKVVKKDGSTLLSFDVGTSTYKTPVAADIDGDGTLEVVVAGAKKVALYKVNARGATLCWSIDGYGSRYDRQARSAVIADMGNGQGYKIIVGGYDEQTGESRIRVLNADGSEDWGYTFAGYYAEFSNTKSGVYQFVTGDFNGDGYTDIAVFLINGSKPLGSNYTETTNIIDGDTHGLLFSDSKLIVKVSPGSVPSNATVCDIDDDGCDELFMTALNYYCTYEYVAGRMERFTQFTRNDYDLYYGTPIPVKTEEGYKLFLSDGYYGFLLMNNSAKRDWYNKYEKYESNFYRLAGIGNFDSDSDLEFAIQIADKGIVIYDLLTGKEEKTIEANPDTFSILTCDIDGDAVDEIIYTVPSGSLYIIDPVTTAVVEYVFDFAVGDVIITDSNGDDLADLIVIGADGRMYGIAAGK